jgi:hypothetical protein
MPLFGNNYQYDSHVVPVPAFLIWVQCAIIVLSLAVIGLVAYPLSFNDGVSGHGNVFTGTIVSSTPKLVSEFILTFQGHYHRVPGRLQHDLFSR